MAQDPTNRKDSVGSMGSTTFGILEVQVSLFWCFDISSLTETASVLFVWGTTQLEVGRYPRSDITPDMEPVMDVPVQAAALAVRINRYTHNVHIYIYIYIYICIYIYIYIFSMYTYTCIHSFSAQHRCSIYVLMFGWGPFGRCPWKLLRFRRQGPTGPVSFCIAQALSGIH